MARGCSVVQCRGCCCGKRRDRPAKGAQIALDLLRELLPEDSTFALSGCLGPCEEADVIVVRPSREGWIDGGRAEWFGRMCDEERVRQLAAYIVAGGPGRAEIPIELWSHRISPGRKGGRSTA